MSWKWKAVLGSAGAFLLIAVAAYFYLKPTLTVENNASCVLSDVVVNMTGDIVWTGTLQAGDAIWLFLHPEHDASFHVTGLCDGRPVEGRMGYVSTGPEAHTIRYSDDGFTYEWRAKP